MDSIGPEDQAKARRFLDSLADIFESAGLDAVLIGGQARNIWAEPRTTLDYDFTTAADAQAIAQVRDALTNQGFRIIRDQGPVQPSGPDFVQLRKESTGEAIDLQTAKTDFQAGIIKRGVRVDPDRPLRVATVEDLLVLKMIANRKKDQDDLYDLANRDGIDWGYVERWAEIWGVSHVLRELREGIEHERRRIEDLYR